MVIVMYQVSFGTKVYRNFDSKLKM